MAWIESHTVLLRHRKLIELANDLQLKPVHAMGHLHALWHAALEQQEDGDLSSWPNSLIASYSGYDGDVDNYVDKLQQRHWLDGKLIHDWLDYAGNYLSRKYHNSDIRKLREIYLRHGKVYGKRGSKSTSLSQNKGASGTGRLSRLGKVGSYDSSFEEFYSEYPRKRGRKQAYEQWQKEAGITNGLPQEIMAGLKKQKEIRAARESLKLFTPEWPDPVRYLRHHRWKDELEIPGEGNKIVQFPTGKYALGTAAKTLRE